MSDSNPMGGRWFREATGSELVHALGSKEDLDVLEVSWMNHTYIRNTRMLIIARTGALGGDVKDVHGGWVYLTDLQMRADWAEIRRIARSRLDLN